MSTSFIPSRDISISNAFLIGAWVEGPLYGLNIAMYICYARILTKDSGSLRKTFLLGIATLQLAFSTAHYIAVLVDLISGFITNVNGPIGPDGYFANSARPVYIAQLFFYFTNYAIGDAIMAWRCYVVWHHNPITGIIFTVMILGSLISGYSTIGHIANLRGMQDLFTVAQWTTAVFTISLGIQISASTLIVVKALRVSSWRHSGVILTAATAADLTLYLLNMNAGSITANIITQTSFLVPMSIIVRARMKAAEARHRSFRSKDTVTVSSWPTRIPTAARAGSEEAPVELNNIANLMAIDAKVDVSSDGLAYRA